MDSGWPCLVCCFLVVVGIIVVIYQHRVRRISYRKGTVCAAAVLSLYMMQFLLKAFMISLFSATTGL
jgi:sorbitol-specific phosphotransferase system component IIC